VIPTATITFAVIAGGGTSGHVLPALAIAELLGEAGHSRDSIHLVGSDRGTEVQLFANSGHDYTLFRVSGLQRSLKPRQLARTAAMVPQIILATRSAKKLLRQLQPRVVVSVGGYASIPATRAARALNVPIVTCSYDRRPGLATVVQSLSAKASAVAYLPSSLRRAKLTGAPVRASLRHLDRTTRRDAARSNLQIPLDRQVVVMIGGSLGSAVLNSALEGALKIWSLRDDLAVLHITGARYLEEQEPTLPQGSEVWYKRIAYCENMADVYAAADLVVARSGASTVAEIATVGIAAILVPWKDSAENHQHTNAQWLTSQGGAVMLNETDLSSESLRAAVDSLMQHPETLLAVSAQARKLGEVHRNCSIATVIEEAARR
jgi:UDP-N-acetylglucosamine--N-acetylmuramyl-(pentapeptide) pyrophosphoryl-undecaprenol N-acetylglucosamine transferase